MSANRRSYGDGVRLPAFPTAPCPICGETFSKCGLPNHVRGHRTRASRGHNGKNGPGARWWEAWQEGYKAKPDPGFHLGSLAPRIRGEFHCSSEPREVGELREGEGRGGEDEMDLLVGTFERALAALAAREPPPSAPTAPEGASTR